MTYKTLRGEMIKHNDAGNKLFNEIDKYIQELERRLKEDDKTKRNM